MWVQPLLQTSRPVDVANTVKATFAVDPTPFRWQVASAHHPRPNGLCLQFESRTPYLELFTLLCYRFCSIVK
jgi:hypothetical protein